MIPRKLAADGAPLRRMAMEHRLEYRAFGRAAVMNIDVCSLKLTPNKSPHYNYKYSFAMSLDATKGGLDLLSLFAVTTEANGDLGCYAELEAWLSAPLRVEAALEGLRRFYADGYTGLRLYHYSEAYLGLAEIALGEDRGAGLSPQPSA